ncbi:TVP38/TMEM64 family protein [Candidatus Peribacteria bacterium]|nr:TVP38/TMEM64 family protein [Candidatus Peribacteria bacterium]
MIEVLKKIWPLLIGLVMFIGVSYVLQSYMGDIETSIEESSKLYGMALYVLLGIMTVMVPFGSLVPFIPVAVALWGWPVAGFLTMVSWILGGQVLFEFARSAGRPIITKLIPRSQMETITNIVKKKGLLHMIFIRMAVHGDIVSYAFGLFTHVSRQEFLLATAIGVGPGAFMYAYMGSLPLRYQITLVVSGIVALTVYTFLTTPARTRKA